MNDDLIRRGPASLGPAPIDPPAPGPDYMDYPLEPPSGLRLQRYFAILREKWWIVPLCLLLTVGASVYYLKIRTPQFQSEASMWVTGRLRLSDGAQYTEDLLTFFSTQIELLQSDEILARALTRLKTTKPDFAPARDNDGRPILPKIKVTQAPKSSVFLLESKSSDPRYAQAFLDAIMQEFMAFKKEIRESRSGGALASVSEQVYKQDNELKLEQEKLHAYQTNNNFALLSEQVNGGGGRLAQLKTQLAMYKLDLHLLDAAALEQVAGGLALTNLPAVAPDLFPVADSTSTTPALPVNYTDANQQIEMRKAEREKLSKYYRPKHPKIVRLDEEIARGEKVLEFMRDQNQEQLAATKQALKMKIESMQETIKELETTVADANIRLAEYNKINANIQRLQNFSDRLLSIMQGVDLGRNTDQENLAILQPAATPIPADRPALQILALAVIAGGMISLGLMFVLSQVDDRFSSLVELRHHFLEEIVGQVPELKGRKAGGANALVRRDDDRHVFAEAYRNLRSSLLFGGAGAPALKILMVTSSVPNEGKSTVAVNLARALSFAGAKVLLIDADLRRGNLHELLGVAIEPGLSDLLRSSDQSSGTSHQSSVISEPSSVKTTGWPWKKQRSKPRTGDGAQTPEVTDQSVPLNPEPLTLNPQLPTPNFQLPTPLTLESCIQATELPNLSFIARGSSEHNPGDLFLKPQYETLLDRIRGMFDHIVIDTIPIFAADDTTTMASKVDGVLFVVRRSYTEAKLARMALELLYQRHSKVIGLVFNRVDSDSRSYAYYKYAQYHQAKPAANKNAEAGKAAS